MRGSPNYIQTITLCCPDLVSLTLPGVPLLSNFTMPKRWFWLFDLEKNGQVEKIKFGLDETQVWGVGHGISMIDSTHNDLYDDIIWPGSPQVWVTYGRKIDFWPFFTGYFGIFGDVNGLKSCQYWYPIANTWFPHPNNYYKPDYNLLLPYLHLKLILHMAKNDKNHVFTAFFWHFLGFSDGPSHGNMGL